MSGGQKAAKNDRLVSAIVDPDGGARHDFSPVDDALATRLLLNP
jgi:hypothetical protein